MQYTNKYIQITRQELLKQVEAAVSPSRFEHILGVEGMAIRLAEHYGANTEKASIAALLHDYAKEKDKALMEQEAALFWPSETLKESGPAIWHGLAAAHLAQAQFKISDPSILQAIAWHTTGQVDMDLLAKVIYTADYTEEGRDFDGAMEVRELAFKNINEACFFQMAHTIAYLARAGRPIFTESIHIYNHWTQKIKEEM